MTRSGERGFLTSHDRETLREADDGYELSQTADRATLKRIQSRIKQALADFAFLHHHLPEEQIFFSFEDAFSEEDQQLPYDDELFDQETIVDALTFILDGIAVVEAYDEVDPYITRAVRRMHTSFYPHRVLGDVHIEVTSEPRADALQNAQETFARTSGNVNALSTAEMRAFLAFLASDVAFDGEQKDEGRLRIEESSSFVEQGLSEAEILSHLRNSPALLEEGLEVAIAQPAASGEAPRPDIICSKDGRPMLVEVKLTGEYHDMIEQTREMLAEYGESIPVELLLVVPNASALPLGRLDETVRVFEVELTSDGETPYTFTEIKRKGA